jgi:hypothetical protein
MINIPKGFLKLSRKGGEGQMSSKVGQPVTPSAPPSKSTSTEQGSSKLAAVDGINKPSGVHVLLGSEQEVGELAGVAIKILWALHLYCPLVKHSLAWLQGWLLRGLCSWLL